jgi:hypothetical protein
MIGWFGKDWGAPVCRESQHTETPVDRPCARCKRDIEAGDDGLVIPHGFGGAGSYVWHLDCFIENLGVKPR